MNGTNSPKKEKDADSTDLTSKDYYFDSYAHFGIHEVIMVPFDISTFCYMPSLQVSGFGVLFYAIATITIYVIT